MKAIKESEKFSLSKCKEILNRNGKNYTDEEILTIRDWLYNVAEFTLTFLEGKSKEEIFEIQKLLNNRKEP